MTRFYGAVKCIVTCRLPLNNEVCQGRGGGASAVELTPLQVVLKGVVGEHLYSTVDA